MISEKINIWEARENESTFLLEPSEIQCFIRFSSNLAKVERQFICTEWGNSVNQKTIDITWEERNTNIDITGYFIRRNSRLYMLHNRCYEDLYDCTQVDILHFSYAEFMTFVNLVRMNGYHPDTAKAMVEL